MFTESNVSDNDISARCTDQVQEISGLVPAGWLIPSNIEIVSDSLWMKRIECFYLSCKNRLLVGWDTAYLVF